ncbi:MAG: hypothetical protein JWQ74_3526 [Marmoricola sp.]|nr:hypothetical protein [Marmoricola sp.]
MTAEEITELFIRAAETDRRLPNTARPARLKAQALPYVYDYKDMAGWGSERLEEERQSFWDARSTRLRTADIADWERCNELIILIDDESQRRCLWHWSIAKAGGRPFSKWCRSEEHIHPETGSRRKDRAVYQITFALARNGLQNNEYGQSSMLPVAPQIADIHVSIEDDAPKHSWMADGAFNPVFNLGSHKFDWAEKRNEQRRQREAKKRQAA